jgi:hypothetical protein
MICDIIERVNIKKVDKCLDSDLHLDPSYITMHPNAERMYCHIWHVRGPNYNHAFYITDMICEMALHPTHAKRLWSEMLRTLKRGKR